MKECERERDMAYPFLLLQPDPFLPLPLLPLPLLPLLFQPQPFLFNPLSFQTFVFCNFCFFFCKPFVKGRCAPF